ncbi:hypothetical protein [Intestinirhabdus alba]|nr:hypothetical protein [Intestinirhabdus alba]
MFVKLMPASAFERWYRRFLNNSAEARTLNGQESQREPLYNIL